MYIHIHTHIQLWQEYANVRKPVRKEKKRKTVHTPHSSPLLLCYFTEERKMNAPIELK